MMNGTRARIQICWRQKLMTRGNSMAIETEMIKCTGRILMFEVGKTLVETLKKQNR